MHQLGDDQEDELVTILLRLHGRAAQLASVVTADAVDRGTAATANAAGVQWDLTPGRMPGHQTDAA